MPVPHPPSPPPPPDQKDYKQDTEQDTEAKNERYAEAEDEWERATGKREGMPCLRDNGPKDGETLSDWAKRVSTELELKDAA